MKKVCMSQVNSRLINITSKNAWQTNNYNQMFKALHKWLYSTGSNILNCIQKKEKNV